MSNNQNSSIVEALILASPDPLPARKIAEVVDDLTPSKVAGAVDELNNRYMETGSSFRIREIAGGYQFYIIPEFVGYVDELLVRRRKMRLTRAALETLAIVAYKQPVTKTEIEHIRGVSSDGVMNNLLEKNMVVLLGRADSPGKPLQYGTGDEFLKFFGLNKLDDLPRMAEIEELLASANIEDKSQMELGGLLEKESDSENVKLNIADGTYDPERESDEDPFSSTDNSIIADDTEPEEFSDISESQNDDEKKEPVGVIVDIDTTGQGE